MAAEIDVNVSSAWKRVTLASVRPAATWKTVYTAWVNVGSVWKVTYRSVQLIGDTASHARTRPTECWAGVTLSVTGNGVEWAVSSAGAAEGTNLQDWKIRGVVGDYWGRCDINVGTLTTSSSTGSWLALTGQLIWRIRDTSTGDGAVTADIDVSIAAGSGGTPLLVDSVNYTLSANAVV